MSIYLLLVTFNRTLFRYLQGYLYIYLKISFTLGSLSILIK